MNFFTQKLRQVIRRANEEETSRYIVGKRYLTGTFRPVYLLQHDLAEAERLLATLKAPQEPGQEWEVFKWEIKREVDLCDPKKSSL